jgi:subtilase family serine protease
VAAGTAGRPAESNETDNDALLAVNGTGWADLVLSGLKVPPAAVDGAEVRLFAEVENAGGSTVRRFTVGFFVDGQKVGDDQVEGLPAGGSAACSAAWKAAPGKHSVRAVVDQDDVVWELDETDNSMRRDGPAVEPPDITVLSVTAAPPPAKGAPAQHRIFVTLENIGGPTLRGFAATVYLDAVPAGNVYSAGLPGRNTTQVSLLVPSGSASTVAVKADEEGALAEGDESNNAASFAFAPVPELWTDRSDLVVRGLWMVPSDPADGQPVRVFAAVGNDGNGTLLNRSRVQMVYQGRNLSSTVEALAPGGTTVVGFDIVAGGGTMAFNATVAHGDPRFESRSDNNRLGASFTAMVPDIRVASVWRSNTTEGLEAPMFAVVENNLTNGSTGDALGEFAVEINIGGGLFVQKAVGGLLAGETHCVAFNWRARPGETDIVAVADPAGAVSDADHGNDRLHDIADTGYPDLLVANITWPALWQNGERTSVFVEVQNDGAATGRAVSVTLSADAAHLGTARLAAMAAYSSTVLAFDWSPSPGNHSFTAVVDPSDELAESNENNNRLVKEMPSGAVSTGPPAVNLHLSGLGYAQWRLPGKGADNQTNVYGLNFTVTNDGEANTSFCAAMLLIDGLQVAELVVPPLSANASANLSFNWLAQYGDYRYKVVLDSRRQLAEDFETDNDDAISIAGNRAPVATTGGPYTASYGDPLTLKGQGFDTNGYIALYEWDLDGDGKFGGRNDTSSTTTGTVTRIFHTAGLYRVSLRVTDDMGATATQTTTVLVKAKPAPPGLDFNALSIVGMTIVFVICSLVVLTILRSEGRIFRRKGR